MKIRRGIKGLSIIVSVLLGLLIPCLFYLYFFDVEERQPLPNAIEITNQPLPASTLVDVEGFNVSSKVREGKVLIIFLSSNCPACKKDVEIISKIYTNLSPKIQIYGVSIEKKDDILTFANKNGIKFPILIDVNAELFNKLQIRYFPTKFLIEDGVIIKTLFGNFPNEEKVFEDLEIGNFK